MPGLIVAGIPRPKGSMRCIGPHQCRHRCSNCGQICGAAVVHQVLPDDPKGTGKQWRALLEKAGRMLRAELGFTYEAPVMVDATFALERSAAAAKRRWPYKPPDVDKLARMLLDALEASRVVANDSLVCELNLRKVFPGEIARLDRAGVMFTVDLMPDPDALPIGGH